jgi:cytochrome c553
MMRPIFRVSLIAALLLAAGVAGAGDPKTALGKWMKPNMGEPFAQDPPDFATLQTSLALLLTKEPPAATYPKWDGFLQQGLAAAKAGDKAGVKATCKGCHDAHKDAYKADPNVPKTFP